MKSMQKISQTFIKAAFEKLTNGIQSTLHIVLSTLYSKPLHIVNNFGETLPWRFIGIVSLYSEPLYIVNKILLQIVFTIWRVDCIFIRFFTFSLPECFLSLHTIWATAAEWIHKEVYESAIILTEGVEFFLKVLSRLLLSR